MPLITPEMQQSLRRQQAQFQRGMFPGAVCGALAGIAPVALLLMILSGGGSYNLPASEVLGFAIMSVGLLSLAGAVIGGLLRTAAAALRRRLTAAR